MSTRASWAVVAALALAVISACVRQSQTEGNPTGIVASVGVKPSPAQVGPAVLVIELRSANGEIIERADVSVRGDMTHAGMVPVFGDADEVSPGTYEAPFEWTMGGDWVLSITVGSANGQVSELTVPYSVQPASQ